MAEVYVGRRVFSNGQLGPVVAVKRLLPHLATDASIVRMFLNEARITAQIHHPNVVQVLELGDVNGEPFIAMELLEGNSFAQLRQKAAENGRRVPLGITLRVLTEACRGLDAAHRAVDEAGRPLCIVHRDFTPDNIHVGVDGHVRVIDFGIAKAENLNAGTEPGILKGKFFYMSPEMIAGHAVDHRADLFAAGVMLYEQLCGRRPFTGRSPDDVLDRIAEGRPRRPSEFDPSVPFELEAVCLTALAREPERRFGNLDEFITAIEGIGGLAGLATPHALATYVSQLFPADQDPRRLSIRNAIEENHEPSSNTFAPVLEATPSKLPTDPASRERLTEETRKAPLPGPPDPPTAPMASEALPAPSGSQAVGVQVRRKRNGPSNGAKRAWVQGTVTRGVMGVGIVAALVLGMFGYRLMRTPGLSPAARLAAAQASEPARRPRLLANLEQDPRATPEQLEEAGSLLVEIQPEEALAFAKTLQRRFPSAAAGPLLEARAAIALRLGKRAEAALAHAQGLAAASDIRPELLRAELREKQGDVSGALEALARARAKQPREVSLWLRQGNLLSQAGQLEEAATVLGQLLDKKGFDAEAAAELAFVRFRQQRLEEARSLLVRAVERQPGLYKAHYYLGAVLFQRGDLRGAERAYHEADGLAPLDPRALSALCELQWQSGNNAAAEQTRAQLAARFPADAKALTGRCTP